MTAWFCGVTACAGVKIEIVDGPLAGVFTFTDDGFGFYDFNGLPPGTIQVRASRLGLQSRDTQRDCGRKNEP